jgi:uncharacterized protein
VTLQSASNPGAAPSGVAGQPAVDQAGVIRQTIAEELGVRAGQVQAAVDLLDGGATVPFIARYRKEASSSSPVASLR